MIQHKPIHTAPPRLQQMLLHMQKYDYTTQYKPSKDMVLADCLSCFPSCSNNLPSLLPTMSSMSRSQRLTWTSFKVQWNMTQCIAPSTASPFEDGPNDCRIFPTLPNTSGAPGTNSPSNLAYSPRGQGYAFPQNSSTIPLLTCMVLTKAWIGCMFRWGRLCIGWA